MAQIPFLPTLRNKFRAHHSILRQSVSYSAHRRPLISCAHEAHRYTIPFHSVDRRKRVFTAYILPYRRHGGRHPNQGPPLT